MSTEQWKPDFTPISTVDAKTADLVMDLFDTFTSPEQDTPERDCLTDVVNSLYGHVYPMASRNATLEEMQARELKQIDHLLMQASENVNSPEIVGKFIEEARQSLDHFAARNDLPEIS